MQYSQTESTAVRNLQTYLRQLSYHFPEIPPPVINGTFDALTRQSVIQFQKNFGLPASGTVNRETWNAVYKAYLQSLSENALPVKISVFDVYPQNQCYKTGSSGFCVLVLQHMLRELQYSMSEDVAIESTGIYDEKTEACVRAFQACCAELHETGMVDRATWNAVARRYNALFDRPPTE